MERSENKMNEKLVLNLINNKSNQKTELIKNNENRNKYIEEKIKKEKNVNLREEGDLAIVLYDHIGTAMDELNLQKDERLIVINWDIGNGYAFGYKINNPQKQGKFPFPLVRKYSRNKGSFSFFFNYINISYIILIILIKKKKKNKK